MSRIPVVSNPICPIFPFRILNVEIPVPFFFFIVIINLIHCLVLKSKTPSSWQLEEVNVRMFPLRLQAQQTHPLHITGLLAVWFLIKVSSMLSPELREGCSIQV